MYLSLCSQHMLKKMQAGAVNCQITALCGWSSDDDYRDSQMLPISYQSLNGANLASRMARGLKKENHQNLILETSSRSKYTFKHYKWVKTTTQNREFSRTFPQNFIFKTLAFRFFKTNSSWQFTLMYIYDVYGCTFQKEKSDIVLSNFRKIAFFGCPNF